DRERKQSSGVDVGVRAVFQAHGSFAEDHGDCPCRCTGRFACTLRELVHVHRQGPSPSFLLSSGRIFNLFCHNAMRAEKCYPNSWCFCRSRPRIPINRCCFDDSRVRTVCCGWCLVFPFLGYRLTTSRMPSNSESSRRREISAWFKNARFRVTLGLSARTLIGPALERVYASPWLPCRGFSSARTGCIPAAPASERAAHPSATPQDSCRLDWGLDCAGTGGGSGRTEATSSSPSPTAAAGRSSCAAGC